MAYIDTYRGQPSIYSIFGNVHNSRMPPNIFHKRNIGSSRMMNISVMFEIAVFVKTKMKVKDSLLTDIQD